MALKSSFGGEKQESSHHAPSLTPQSNHSCFDTTVFLPTYLLIALQADRLSWLISSRHYHLPALIALPSPVLPTLFVALPILL